MATEVNIKSVLNVWKIFELSDESLAFDVAVTRKEKLVGNLQKIGVWCYDFIHSFDTWSESCFQWCKI